MVSRTRGRPPKFGRPARLVALTLPEDTIKNLQAIDADLAKAVVALVDRAHGRTSSAVENTEAPVSLAHVSASRALIVIDPMVFREIPGCALVPLSDRHAFLALEAGRTLADLELSITDLLEEETGVVENRQALGVLRQALRDWRRDDSLAFHTRSIVLVERPDGWRP
jgi:hypothetical protein